jgi:hypothetical protein
MFVPRPNVSNGFAAGAAIEDVDLIAIRFCPGITKMSVYQTISDIDEIDAPWGKHVILQGIGYEGGMAALRMRIKEGSRFTDLELDPASAARIGRQLLDWSNAENAATGADLERGQ